MHKQTAKFLKLAAEEAGVDDFRVDEAYSGRGMYGGRTHAVICGPHDVYKLIATAAIRVYEENENGDYETEDGERYDVDEFIEDVDHLRRDNMGRDDIVLY